MGLLATTLKISNPFGCIIIVCDYCKGSQGNLMNTHRSLYSDVLIDKP